MLSITFPLFPSNCFLWRRFRQPGGQGAGKENSRAIRVGPPGRFCLSFTCHENLPRGCSHSLEGRRALLEFPSTSGGPTGGRSPAEHLITYFLSLLDGWYLAIKSLSSDQALSSELVANQAN